MQTADCWQLLFSDRFTGARNPARLSTTDAIPSKPLRPLSVSFYHQDWVNPARAPAFDTPVTSKIAKNYAAYHGRAPDRHDHSREAGPAVSRRAPQRRGAHLRLRDRDARCDLP